GTGSASCPGRCGCAVAWSIPFRPGFAKQKSKDQNAWDQPARDAGVQEGIVVGTGARTYSYATPADDEAAGEERGEGGDADHRHNPQRAKEERDILSQGKGPLIVGVSAERKVDDARQRRGDEDGQHDGDA